MSAYRIRRENGFIVTCDSCQSEAPLEQFEDDRSIKLLCEYCASSTGQPFDIVTKIQMAQMFNVLEQRLAKRLAQKRGSER